MVPPQHQPQPPSPVTPAPVRAGRGRKGEPGPKGRFLVWVDTVGGYLVCLDDEVILGQAGPNSQADVPLMGDLSRNHATLVRDGEKATSSRLISPRSSTAGRSKPLRSATAT